MKERPSATPCEGIHVLITVLRTTPAISIKGLGPKAQKPGVPGLEFEVWGLRGLGLGFRVWGLGV